MKYLKYVIAVLVVLAIIPVFLPATFEVSRTVLIEDTQEDVYSYLVNLESWAEWNPWLDMEPEAEINFEGIPGVVGSSSEWKGREIGHGRQILTKLQEPEYLETRLEFMDPKSSDATAYMKITPQGDKTQVVWGMKGPLSYPVERLMGVMMPGLIGKQFEAGLKKLKAKLEEPKS